ncbi:MAG: hypothetical protein JWL95_25 [Gemmatimonadetes bacterium]|nr:hypothetical protein [Gemmatimonadota bacterium]
MLTTTAHPSNARAAARRDARAALRAALLEVAGSANLPRDIEVALAQLCTLPAQDLEAVRRLTQFAGEVAAAVATMHAAR